MKKLLYLLTLLISQGITAQQYFISTAGSDKNAGTIQSPVASFDKVKTLLQKLTTVKDTIHIYFRGGEYDLQQNIELNYSLFKAFTDKTVVIIEAYRNEKVVLKGSYKIPARLITKIKTTAIKEKIKAALVDSIYEIDLNSLPIAHNKKFPDVFEGDGNLFQLFINNQKQQVSRYPNIGYMTMKKVIINGGGQETKGEDWRNFYGNDSKGKILPPRPGVFEYRDTRENAWTKSIDNGIWLKGYWRIPWQNEAVRVAKIDTANKTITLAAPIQGGIGSKYHRPEGSGKERYWLLNLPKKLMNPANGRLIFHLINYISIPLHLYLNTV